MEPWSVLYLDLNNFKAFNDVYGFLAGNDMILLVGHICQRVVYEHGNTDDFVGHIGGDDFVIVTTPDREKVMCRLILERYKQESAVLYRKEDLERGWISGVDRDGKPYDFPLVSLSIGVVSDQLLCSQSIDEVGTLTAEAKHHAKRSSSNVYHLASQWNDSSAEYPYLSHMPSSFAIFGHVGHNAWRFAEEDAFAEI
jgi:GGDEF domain-containing protein